MEERRGKWRGQYFVPPSKFLAYPDLLLAGHKVPRLEEDQVSDLELVLSRGMGVKEAE